MTLTALPINASSGSPAYTSQQFRQAMSALMSNDSTRPVGARSGYGVGHQPTTLTASSTTWTVGPFSCVIDPAFTTTQGPYLVSSDANATGSVTAAPGSPNNRIDILYAQVNDTDIDSSGLRSVTVNYLAGTAGTSPSAPATPARSFLLATISVPFSGSPTIAVNNTFCGAGGAVVPVANVAGLPATAAEGMGAYLMDSNTPVFWDLTNWRPTYSVRQEITNFIDGPGSSQPPSGSTTILSTSITTTGPATVELEASVTCYVAATGVVAGTVPLSIGGSVRRTLRMFWHSQAGYVTATGTAQLFVPTAGSTAIAIAVASDAGSAGGSLIIPEFASYSIREIR